MQNLLTFPRTLAAVLLIGVSACARGQALGTPVADALLGRPLDMSLPARFASADSSDECVRADVFYGESRLKPADVRTTVSGPADQRRIRVEADRPIDEPFVTVSVRAGCRNTVTRNYTLLPQFPSEQLLAAVDARAALATATPVAPLKLAKATAQAPRVRAVPAARKTVVAAGPRLKVEPLELPERDALLHVSNSLAQPEGDASRRAAAALLWQAINADPQEVMRTTVMLQKMEQDLAQLRQGTNQARADIAGLRARLDAQPGVTTPTLVQALLLLLAAAGAGAAVLWVRTRHLAAAPGAWYLPPGTEAAEPECVAEIETAETAVARPEPAVTEVVERSDAPTASAVPPDTDATLRVETLASTFEEVDFLSSMGLPSDAMEILKAYLQDSAKPSPLAYLALMHLCERAEDPAAVAAVRRRYAQTYGVEAPRLAQIAAERGLETLPDLAARVTRAWDGPDRLATLEAALFSVPTPAAPMTLQAIRELLSLHELARAEAGEATGGQGAHPLAPWARAEGAHDAQPAAHQLAEADGGTDFALDLDLGAAPPEPLPEPQAPEVQLGPMLEKLQAESARDLARWQQEQEDAFSAAVASERIPVSRY
jgi:pilus assembly protein FimV